MIAIRTRALHLANERIAAAEHATGPDLGLEDFARQVQDAILATRQDQVQGAGVVLPVLPAFRPGRLRAGGGPAVRTPHRPRHHDVNWLSCPICGS